MAAIVPARLTQVDAAHERDIAVDDRELLVMRAARYRRLVEAEVKTLTGHPVKHELLHPLALEREDQVEVPGQDVNLQRGGSLAELIQKLQQAYFLTGFDVVAAEELHAAVELPARQQNAVLGFERRLIKRAIVVSGVDQHPRRIGAGRPPDVASRFDDLAPLGARPWFVAHRSLLQRLCIGSPPE
jgi:hypothetical protein